MSYERPLWAANDMQQMQNFNATQNMGQQRMVAVDVNEFIRTRDALAAAYLNLSGSFERAVKAYLDHTQVVLNGDATLNPSHLLHFFNGIPGMSNGAGSFNPAQMASMALQQNGGMAQGDMKTEEADGKKRKKRAYKARDPNAPKRPLTAYFRYLGDMRHTISEELQKNPEKYKDIAGQPGDISRIATERWKKLTDEEREPYKAAYQAELVGYNERAAEYAKTKGVAPEDLAAIDETEVDVTGITEPDLKPATPIDAPDDDDSSDVSSDSTSSDDTTDDEESAPPTPAKAPTPKKSSKKSKTPATGAPVAQMTAPTPSFSSINNKQEPSSSPSRKRKGDASESETTKKRKGRSDDANATAGSEKKKDKKKKKA